MARLIYAFFCVFLVGGCAMQSQFSEEEQECSLHVLEQQFEGSVFKDKDVDVVSGMGIIIAEFKLQCGEPPPMNEYIFKSKRQKVRVQGYAVLFGQRIPVDCNVDMKKWTFNLEKYICDAKSHHGQIIGAHEFQLVATPSVSVTQYRYCDPSGLNNEGKYKYSKIDYHSFINYEVRSISRTQCRQ